MAADDAERPRTPVVPAHLVVMAARNEPPLTHTPMWTLDELCEKFHVSHETVHTWRKRGTAPKAYVIGRHLMFEESDVRTWLDARTTASEEERRPGTGSGW